MKKTFTFLLAAAASFAAQAQVTIDSTDVAVIGKTIVMATDTAHVQTGITSGGSGANQTWNYSSLDSFRTDTITFLPPAGSPFAANFPDANVYGLLDEAHAYFVKNGSGLYADGVAAAFIGTIDNNPNERVIMFPMTMGNSFNDTSKMSITMASSPMPGVDSMRSETTKHKTATADAWGTITTPGGTFSAIRVMSVEYTVDSTFLHTTGAGWSFDNESYDTNYVYQWWAKGQYMPVMSMDSSTFGGGKSISFIMPHPTSVKEYAKLNASVYPNPANDVLYIRSQSAKVSYAIYDMKGVLIRQQSNVSGNTHVPVADLSAGTYLYSVTDQDGKAARGTFQVAH